MLINHVKNIDKNQAAEVYKRLPKPDKFIFAIGIETGLRISDILKLKNSDITNPMNVYVSRIQTVQLFPISAWLYNELISRSEYDWQDVYIFNSQRKHRRHMHRTTYHRHIKKALEGLNFDCSAHSTRKLYLINHDY